MAVPWLTVLKNVPWNDVIGNAPAVADRARKLWGTVGRRSGLDGAGTSADNPDMPPAPPAAASPVAAGAPPSAEALAIEALQQRVTRLDASHHELREQVRAGSALISQLAEQNTQLIARLELTCRRLRWATWGVGASAVAALVALVLAVTR